MEMLPLVYAEILFFTNGWVALGINQNYGFTDADFSLIMKTSKT